MGILDLRERAIIGDQSPCIDIHVIQNEYEHPMSTECDELTSLSV